jgi:hypothetical protein
VIACDPDGSPWAVVGSSQTPASKTTAAEANGRKKPAQAEPADDDGVRIRLFHQSQSGPAVPVVQVFRVRQFWVAGEAGAI